MYILNYILSALFLLAFSLKDLHPILAHHHTTQKYAQTNTDTKIHVQDVELDQDCFICDLFFSVKALTGKSLPEAVLAETSIKLYAADYVIPISISVQQLSARAPPVVIES